MKHSGGPLDNQTWQTEWKTAPLVKVQLCAHDKQSWKLLLGPAVSLASLMVQWPARIFLRLATAHDCETVLLLIDNNCNLLR